MKQSKKRKITLDGSMQFSTSKTKIICNLRLLMIINLFLKIVCLFQCYFCSILHLIIITNVLNYCLISSLICM